MHRYILSRPGFSYHIGFYSRIKARSAARVAIESTYEEKPNVGESSGSGDARVAMELGYAEIKCRRIVWKLLGNILGISSQSEHEGVPKQALWDFRDLNVTLDE